ncbi:MAG: reverse transcriptase/maturase family protein [bacterium]|nr:reverse transcriptase/maturase family protein [bacterium]
MVHENKKRTIAVAPIRDRIVHRLLYEYLVLIFDQAFIYDAWSCRRGKGLIGAVDRTQEILSGNSRSFVWRTDIRKFFDSVNCDILLHILKRKIQDKKALWLLEKIISSYHKQNSGTNRESEERAPRIGIPIGNLTSQIFANIYLNELDRFVSHVVRPAAYLRYGDDFIIVHKDPKELIRIRTWVRDFLRNELNLELNPKNDILVPARRGLKFLGVEVFPRGKRLLKRNQQRVKILLNQKNISSYYGVVKQHEGKKKFKEFLWKLLDLSDG